MKEMIGLKQNRVFDDKVVIITGAGSGLGQASALQIAKEGGSLL